jgi:hypothetical protein
MGAQVNFYGFIKANDTNWETFDFEMDDIYVGELSKWLKADSPDASKTFFDLEILRNIKSFGFYTSDQNKARWAAGKEQMLNDFFQYKKSRAVFTLKIIAASSNFTSIIKCTDCEPMNSMLMKTPIGTMQSYIIKYKDAIFERVAGSQARG